MLHRIIIIDDLTFELTDITRLGDHGFPDFPPTFLWRILS